MSTQALLVETRKTTEQMFAAIEAKLAEAAKEWDYVSDHHMEVIKTLMADMWQVGYGDGLRHGREMIVQRLAQVNSDTVPA